MGHHVQCKYTANSIYTAHGKEPDPSARAAKCKDEFAHAFAKAKEPETSAYTVTMVGWEKYFLLYVGTYVPAGTV